MFYKQMQISNFVGAVLIMGLALVAAYVAFTDRWLDVPGLIIFGVLWFGMCWALGIGAAQGPFDWNGGTTSWLIIILSILFAIFFVLYGARAFAGLLSWWWGAS